MKVDSEGNISFDFVADLIESAKTTASSGKRGELLRAAFMDCAAVFTPELCLYSALTARRTERDTPPR